MKEGYDVFLVCSCGGHLTQILKLNEAYKDYSHLFIISGRYDPVDEMHDRAVLNVKNNFSLENMCKKTLEVYKRLLISEWISWHDIFRRQS